MLATETLPYETPIIFSNEGLYNNVLRAERATGIMRSLIDGIITGESAPKFSPTNPHSYKIRKNAFEFRRLALVHPTSQWRIKAFYEKYENLILHFCSLSPASIRAPNKVAATFYTKSSWENINQYKNGSVAETETDRFTKYSPSFFAYRGHDRLYKFFDSRDFLELEKAYGFLWTLDVSKCFDSIYTHCMSWAVKDKEFTKAHVDIDSTFGQAFDSVMRNANHNETNGIVIGPEVSRIFAEIIFQAVDRRAFLRLSQSYKLIFGIHYEVRRYVDDVFIFARNEGDAKTIYECYSDTLTTFNLHTNAAKSLRLARPFFTKKSRITRDVSNKANEFFDKFLEDVDDASRLIPKKIYYQWRLTRSFVDIVKSVCSYNDVTYDDVSSYLISTFTERVKKLANINLATSDEETLFNYRDSSLVLLDVLFFLYSVAPSVSSSYKLATSIIVLIRFAEKNLGVHKETVKQRIFDLANAFLSRGNEGSRAAIEGFTWLEASNVLLAVRELGANYLLPESTVKSLFEGTGKFSYFDIVCGLFYVRKDPAYRTLRRSLVKAADARLRNLTDIFVNSEKAHLFLDMITCPYIYHTQRRRWIEGFYAQMKLDAPTADELADFIARAATQYWFVNWTEVDLLNSLEKKELKRAY
ncbi:antiviral reverse transcriptase Drt3b [Caballeronia mineralivorans]|uniref:antiviral reverse transcriptase Drt3b n=1 Tax=Caballeronia mineralivorans TaxID=2010198 RepID=UPI001F362080|nr:antiviral reverse transcriptase Drt3b [Caballeronia mineralivorans]